MSNQRTYLSKAIKEKYGIPLRFTAKKDEVEFYRKMDGNIKVEIGFEMWAEYVIKKYGYIPRLEKVVTIRNLRKKKRE